MSSVNLVILIGRLGSDPEVRSTQSGTPMAKLSLATSDRVPGKDGEREERTEWHSVVVFGKQAEHCGTYLQKGRQIHVEGRLQSREYKDKDGIDRKVVEVIARNVVFLGDRGGQGAPQGAQAGTQAGWGQQGAQGWGQPAGGGGWGQQQGGGQHRERRVPAQQQPDLDPIPF